MNPIQWWRVYRRVRALKRIARVICTSEHFSTEAARRDFVEARRREAFGEITPETRAEDRQRLADAVAGKADRLI